MPNHITQTQVGQRIKLVNMHNDPAPIEPGAMGTIVDVVDCEHPSTYSIWENGKPVETGIPGPTITQIIYVDWDNGRNRSLLKEVDEFEIIET